MFRIPSVFQNGRHILVLKDPFWTFFRNDHGILNYKKPEFGHCFNMARVSLNWCEIAFCEYEKYLEFNFKSNLEFDIHQSDL